MVFQKSNPFPKSIFDNVAYGLRLNRLTRSREELRGQMVRPGRDPAGYPVVTYGMGAPVTFHLNGETIDLIPVRAAHTSGASALTATTTARGRR